MSMEQVRPDLWRWTAPHPEWKPSATGTPGEWGQLVGSVLYEPPEPEAPLVLVDPQAPAAGSAEAAAFWKKLDGAVERRGRPVAVLVANCFHHRSAKDVLERYRERPGAEIWAPESARAHLEKVACPVTRYYQDGEILPGGLVAYEVEGLCPGEAALYLPRHQAVIAADALLGSDGGKLRVPPVSWSADAERYHQRLRPSIQRLLEVPVEMVLVSHGQPVLSGGRRAIQEALS
jgi:glyoxylase-like metal-dependent hydrolase (beta-lactamase superfamily II)